MFQIVNKAWYWLAIIVIGLSMEAVALYFQYGLDYGPCILCSHIRAWVLAIVLAAVLGLFLRSNSLLNGVCHLLMLGLCGGLLWSSWQTLGIERGWFEGSCDFSSGYPDWFPLHEWAPALFEPWELCGYTPELLFGVTMAEGLLVIAIAAMLVFLSGSVVTLLNLRRSAEA